MDSFVFTAVLLAAFLHAVWNVLVRMQADRLVSLATVQGAMGLLGLLMLMAFGLPRQDSWIYALVSGLLHTGYNLFLVRAYKTADLSLVYPIARGSAPLFTLLASLVFLHDGIRGRLIIAILLLVIGLLMASWPQGNRNNADPQAVLYALGTAAFISVYSITDGLGARAAGDAFGYAGLLFVLDGAFFLMAASYMRGAGFTLALLPHWRQGLLGGCASSIAYAIVMWAMTKAPIASVAALREISIIFVLLMSSQMLRERLTFSRITGALLIMLGAMLLRIG